MITLQFLLGTEQIYEIFVDDEDEDLFRQHEWYLHQGYATRCRKKADGPGPDKIFLHRAIMERKLGMPKHHWSPKKILLSALWGVAFLALSLVANYLAGTYASANASNPVAGPRSIKRNKSVFTTRSGWILPKKDRG